MLFNRTYDSIEIHTHTYIYILLCSPSLHLFDHSKTLVLWNIITI